MDSDSWKTRQRPGHWDREISPCNRGGQSAKGAGLRDIGGMKRKTRGGTWSFWEEACGLLDMESDAEG